jgi:hypothetical protein
MFGHWLFDAPSTATSMIGFIALAAQGLTLTGALANEIIQENRGCWKQVRSVSSPFF